MPGSQPPPARMSERPSQRPGGATHLLGTVIGGRYRLDSVLGEGGMGTVYAAEHMLMRKRVALKVLHPDMGQNPDVVARFEREAMAAAHIDHPNIAAATDFGQLPDGSFFLVLEFVEGENLRTLITRGHLGVDRAVHIGMQIANALARAHSLGVVHRDLKPDNVMLITKNGDADFVKILDFGIAKVPVLDLGAKPPPSVEKPPPVTASPRVLTQIGMIYGTPEYMSPEQALGQPVDSRADLYAVGVLLYEMLTGKRPFDHDNMATLLGLHVTAKVPPMAERAPDVAVPSAVEAVVRRLLAKDPAERFATAAALEEALSEARLVSLPTEPPPTLSPAARGFGLSQVPRWAWPAGALGVVTSALLVTLLFRPVHPAKGGGTDSGGVPAEDAAVAPTASEEPPVADPLAPVIAAAEASLHAKDAAAVIVALSPLEAANANRADVHRLLERAYAMSHDRAAAMREADAWLGVDPSAVSDLKLQADVGEAATRVDTSDAAIAVLAARLGAPGVDILYDLAYAGATSWLTPKALAALGRPDVRAHAGPAAALRLDLRGAKECAEWRALLPRVKAEGDRRAVVVLKTRAPTHCLHNADLKEAIATASARGSML